MNKNSKKSISWSLERKAIIAFLLVFVGIISSAWIYAMRLRQSVAANTAVVNIDPGALIEIERLRNVAESQFSNSRSFFLLGSKALFDQQKKDKQTLAEASSGFAKKYNLTEVPAILKRIDDAEQKQQEIFDQAMKFREKQTESKIVGQFYQSKIAPLRSQINEALDEIVRLHSAELDQARAHAREAALEAQVQIPRGMTWLTGLVGFLFLAMILLVIRVLRRRTRLVAERDRLFSEIKKTVQDRDEVISAISHDLKDPLSTINEIVSGLATLQSSEIDDSVQLIKNSVLNIENIIKDICDQKNSDMGTMALRLDQQAIDGVLDEARMALQVQAKQRDIRLHFEPVNPPVLAFFDRERVMRVFLNLVGNAIKFSPKHSKVVVKVRSDQKFVYVSVVDSGPGIPENQLSQLFDHFWQAHGTSEQGAGIGLTVTKTIVEAHGGTLTVDSKVGNGSTFTFSLPRRRPVGAHLKKPAPVVRIGKSPPIYS